MDHLKSHLERIAAKQSKVMTLSPSQFKERFPSLDYQKEADRKKAVEQTSVGLKSALLSLDGKVYEPPVKPAKAIKPVRTAKPRARAPQKEIKVAATPKPPDPSKIRLAIKSHIESLQSQGMSKAQIISTIRKFYPANLIAEAT
jgi:hypothetical protein